MSCPSCSSRVTAEAMSSCNVLPQMWAIKPMRTVGWAFKKSCNGGASSVVEALQDFFRGSEASAGRDAEASGSNIKVSCIADSISGAGLRWLYPGCSCRQALTRATASGPR